MTDTNDNPIEADDPRLFNPKLVAALQLAINGFPVFPCKPNGKYARDKGWQAQATVDPVQVFKWWTNDPDCNIGVFTDRLLVLDADVKPDDKGNPQNGYETLEQLQLEHGRLPDTARTKTTSGGGHFIFTLPDGVWVPNSESKLGKGLDVRSRGGLIVAPGSTIDGKTYEWVNARMPVPAPDWLIELCGRAKGPGENVKVERKPRAALRAPEWINQVALDRIKNWAPAAFPGGGWSGSSFSVWPDALNRGCEERLSIYPGGISDFGQDFGDGAPGYTATGVLEAFFDRIEDGELVPFEGDYDEKWKPAGKLPRDQARNWLCDKLELDWDKLVEEDRTNAEGFNAVEETVAGLDTRATPISLKDWLDRHLPEPEFISGRWLTTTSRVLVVAPTGLGKSLLLIALAMAIAAGRGFLHWVEGRPAKVLYIDGEMSARLLKRRLTDR
jgi:hypothetical protein